jgi:hypothetical protein
MCPVFERVKISGGNMQEFNLKKVPQAHKLGKFGKSPLKTRCALVKNLQINQVRRNAIPFGRIKSKRQKGILGSRQSPSPIAARAERMSSSG